jgi:aspartyl-tRNA(Asn)/glutamyl-tRNA(Gln) amidotransferase subunit A
MTDWTSRPISELQAALRAKRLTVQELTEAAIARHTRYGERLRAYKTWDPEAARRQAAAADAAFARGQDLGPLHGIPVSVKDLYGVPGWPTFAGTPKRMSAAWESPGPVVAALTGQRAVVMGKTHTVEFAYGGLGTNPHWGAPWNPWDAQEHRAPGGSSAGAGVSLVEGSAFVALGTDTGGSVRVPASLTGTVGLKTTKGRWPTDGIVPLSQTLDTPGILTRTAADAALAFAAIEARLHGAAPRLFTAREVSTLQLAVTKDYFWDCTADIARAVEGAIRELTDAGASVREITLPEAAEAANAVDLAALLAVEGYANVAIEFPDWEATLDPHVKRRMEDSRSFSAADYLAALAHLRRVQAAGGARLADIDALLTPTVPISPPRIADVAQWDSYRVANAKALANTSVGNRLGLCAMTLPVGLDAHGMPVGLQLIAAAGRDAHLVEVALAAEGVLGTARDRLGVPPVLAA